MHHFLFGFQIVLGRVELHAVHIRQCFSGLDAEHDLMGVGTGFLEVMGVVGDY